MIAEEVLDQLLKAGLDIRRVLVGTFVTSLDGPGFSVTVLKLQERFEVLLNTRTTAPAWPNHVESTDHVNDVGDRMVEVKTEAPIGGNEVLLPGMCSATLTWISKSFDSFQWSGFRKSHPMHTNLNLILVPQLKSRTSLA